MRSLRAIGLAVVVGASHVAPGCDVRGEDVASVRGNAADGIDVGLLCDAWTRSLCDAGLTCSWWTFRDREHCLNAVGCPGVMRLDASVRAGSVSYDEELGVECLEQRGASCSTSLFGVLSQCVGVLEPELQAGDACSVSAECPEENYCDGELRECPGTCRPLPGSGEPCAAGPRPCAPGLLCGRELDGTRRCAPPAVEGEWCDVDTSRCASGDAECAEDLWCDPEVGVYVRGRGIGEPCGAASFEDESYELRCAPDLYCDTRADAPACRERGQAGHECLLGNECADGLRCDGQRTGPIEEALGMCAAVSAEGGPCVGDQECEGALLCIRRDGDGEGACAPASDKGEYCENERDCAADLDCFGQVCLPHLFPGDDCSEPGQPCTASRCLDGECVYLAAVGEKCGADADCVSGACVDEVCRDVVGCGGEPL